jgi:hypothetical protein
MLICKSLASTMLRQKAIFISLSCKRLKGVNPLGFAMWLLLEIATVYNFHIKCPEPKVADCGFPCGTMVLNVWSCTPMPHMEFKSEVLRRRDKCIYIVQELGSVG